MYLNLMSREECHCTESEALEEYHCTENEALTYRSVRVC